MSKKTIIGPAFYDAMGYPYPNRRHEMGLIGEACFGDSVNNFQCDVIPPTPLYKGGLLHSVTLPVSIQSYIHYASYIPGLLQLYVVNSRSFHAEHADSDIDLLVISQDGCTRGVRFCLIVIAKMMGIYRSPGDTADKVCLSFCLDHKSMNLSGMSLGQIDYYLIYRVAHATCIYSVPSMSPDAIRHANHKLMLYLPGFALSIIPTQEEFHGPSLLPPVKGDKGGLVYTFSLQLFRGISHLIYICRSPIMIYRANRMPLYHQGFICQPSVIKCYQDKRAIYNRLVKQQLMG